MTIITQKEYLTLATNGRCLPKKWVTALIENDNFKEIVGRCHAHGGTKFFIGSCIPSKYINQGKTSGSSFHQKSLPYGPNHFSLTTNSGSHRLGPWVTKMTPGFAGFLMAFAGNLNIHLGFPMYQPRSSSQGFKRTHQGPMALMLTLLGLAFSQKWHRFFFAIGELGKPLTILPFAACPLC